MIQMYYNQYLTSPMYHNFIYGSRAISFSRPTWGEPNGQMEQDSHFWSTNYPIRKMQTEMIKIPGTFGLLTVFMELPTENAKKATHQFESWMEKNCIDIKKEWETYFPMFLRGPTYRWWISTKKAIDNSNELLESFRLFFQEKEDLSYWN
jgi:hypothetical protein